MLYVVTVGESICGSSSAQKMETSHEDIYLRGHNTFAGPNPSSLSMQHDGAGEIVSAVNGYVEITDRVVSVKGKVPRYQPEIGDVVIGRVIEVTGKRWLVDLNGSQTAIMLLSNVTEPGGMLRRRGRGDELGMRHLFDQGDLIVAEVQRITQEGGASLHTRAAEKYGKLSSLGQLVTVRPSLIKRAKHQFFSMEKYGCDIIIGLNGYIWVSQSPSSRQNADSIETEVRKNVARIANCIKALGNSNSQVFPNQIESIVEESEKAGLSPCAILDPVVQKSLISKLILAGNFKRPRE